MHTDLHILSLSHTHTHTHTHTHIHTHTSDSTWKHTIMFPVAIQWQKLHLVSSLIHMGHKKLWNLIQILLKNSFCINDPRKYTCINSFLQHAACVLASPHGWIHSFLWNRGKKWISRFDCENAYHCSGDDKRVSWWLFVFSPYKQYLDFCKLQWKNSNMVIYARTHVCMHALTQKHHINV